MRLSPEQKTLAVAAIGYDSRLHRIGTEWYALANMRHEADGYPRGWAAWRVVGVVGHGVWRAAVGCGIKTRRAAVSLCRTDAGRAR